ncbi:hypothetical protein FEM48_Zijuj01G0300100 [Ziziphus jujuba var. spinosa]|uniref:RING-type E3 ubiquitin transferase n=1 Tax=Ziziphus jujuba var. spinosa TaxID=714518 RepID=A0A978W5W3_ZIZJJ|nr:hypothetical protein FEM48_Zijuj01G0300100 [Ziziphus jujuba var. spinosa]
MNIATLALVLCTVFGLLGLGYSDSFLGGGGAEIKGEYQESFKYDRINEVEKECSFVLSSASELKPEDNRIYSIKEELFFVNGDWRQVDGKAPLMPFDVREVQIDFSADRTPLNLVSFWVLDVDRARRSKKAVSISGSLIMGITLDSTLTDYGFGGNPQFQMWPGHSQLPISFQGIYTESKKNGGERVMCLLGSTMLPARESDAADPWQWLKAPDANYNQLPLLQDDRILLVLRYPMTFSLTNRAIQGQMRSLNPKSNEKYFDEVHISSQLGKSANYEFASQKIVSKACAPYPYNNDSFLNSGIGIYKGLRFCEIFEEITRDQAFTVLPNWKCNSKGDFCSKLGPFEMDKEIKATNGSFKGVKLHMQYIKCEQTTARANATSARVSAVFRAVSPLENLYTAGKRSGLSNMTVAAEGFWKSTSGQLCMVGCLGFVDASGSSCNSRICLYVPISFSIKQRSIIYGTLSSINNSSPSYFPLSFEKLVQPTELWNYFKASNPYYSYTKINSAGAILERDTAFSFRTIIKKSLLTFPKLEDTEAYQVSLSLLSEDLTLHVSAVPDPRSPQSPRIDIQMEILSVGPLFGRYWSAQNGSTTEEEIPYHTKAEYTEKQLLLNVSAQLTVSGKDYSNFSVLFLEGLYDEHVGKMYLVGCRDVRASWEILYESMDLDSGLDCLIEVVVSYPPTTSRWLVNPTASISIASRRNEDDPLRFSTVKFQTLPIMYRKQREDILSRRGIEGILRILTLSLAIACISSQLFHIKHDPDSVHFISLVMLGVQAIGYSLPLVTGAEALFKKKASESYESAYDLENSQWFKILDYAVKLLVLVSFLLTLRLCQKVWRSRIRLLTRAPLEPHRVPSDKRVFLTTLTLHLVGFIIVLIVHNTRTSQNSIWATRFKFARAESRMRDWETELEEYVGLVHDFFLLPQIIGNFIWQIDCKPLRKIYFIGITLVRLFPHIYDYIRAPVLNPYFAEDYEFANPSRDFYSKFGDVAIPVTAILFAVAVYIQQRWNYEKLSQTLTVGQYRLLPLGSRMYERLPSSSQAFEAELVSGVNGNSTHEKEHDVE